MDQTQALIRLGRAQQKIRDVMETLEIRSYSKHDVFWDPNDAEIRDTLEDVRLYIARLNEQMNDLHNLLWDDDE